MGFPGGGRMKSRRDLLTHAVIGAIVVSALLQAATAQAQQGDGTDFPVSTNIFKPDKVPADAAHIAQLKVPAGFAVNVFARDLKNARVIVAAPNGDVYVSR